jgi:hypothetical protein
MKWIDANSNSTSNEVFELWNEDVKLMDISFNKTNRIARLVSNLGKRLFFFERSGFLHPKAVLKNEYGIKMGKVEEEHKQGVKKGFVELDGQRYCYTYNSLNTGELNVYDEGMKKNLLTCSLNAVSKNFNKAKSLLDTKFPSLLMAMCWYSFQQHTLKNFS